MRILLLSHYFPPEVNAPANRTVEHCRVWADMGHDVHVITCVPSHPAGVPFPGYRAAWYRRECIDGITVHRVWTLLAPNRGLARRTLNYLSFVPSAVWRGWTLGRVDVIAGTSPQLFCAAAAWLLARFRRTPWVFEVRDLWPESIPAVGAMRPSFALRMLERLELFLYRHATAIVCVSRAIIDNLTRRGVDPAKLHYVPNGIEPEFWEGGDREAGRRMLKLSPAEIGVAYVGTVGMAHGLGTLLDAASALSVDPRIRVIVVGDGAERRALERRAAAEGLRNVAFTGLVPRTAIASVLAAADVALVTLKPSEVFKTVLPSKMFEAMAAGCPILLGVEGEALEILDRVGAGLAVVPGSADALIAAIQRLADQPSLRKTLGANGRAFVRREFNRRVWAGRMLHVLEDIAAGAHPVRVPASADRV
jgi:glycosyltransferase involved in cell wall biosynthesis